MAKKKTHLIDRPLLLLAIAAGVYVAGRKGIEWLQEHSI